jgi:site-specific recombinase XerC
MILLARYACLRLTELSTLHTNAREGDLLRIVGKGRKERMVGVNEPLRFALNALEREQGQGYYFPGQVGHNTLPHLHPQSVCKIIKRVTGWNPHSLRHAGATAAYRATNDLRGVQDMLGHASLATTQRYLHLDDASRLRIADATIIPGTWERIAA